MNAVLELRNVGVRFGGLTAIDDVCISIAPGMIAGIIGPNGAGKSTLFNVITGLYEASSGSVLLNGENLARRPVHSIMQRGIARTFQNIRLFAFMTARENVMVGRHARGKTHLWDALLHTPAHKREEAAFTSRADELLALVGLSERADEAAHFLSYGEQRRLEIARALAGDPRILLLDEPAAGMNPTEKRELAALLQVIRERGVTVVLIEHDMSLVMSVCEYLWVLDHGVCIAGGNPEAVRNNPAVITAYLGADA